MKWEIIKNKLQNRANEDSYPVDIDELWGSIESEVDSINKQKKNKKYFFFFLVFLLFISVFGTGLTLNKSNELLINLSDDQATKNSEVTVYTGFSEKEMINVNESKKEKEDHLKKSSFSSSTVDQQEDVKQDFVKKNHPISKISTVTVSPNDIVSENGLDKLSASYVDESQKDNFIILPKEQWKTSDGQIVKLGIEDKNDHTSLSALFLNEKSSLTGLELKREIENEEEIPLKILSVLDYKSTSSLPIFLDPLYESQRKATKPLKWSVSMYGGVSYTQRKVQMKNVVESDLLQIRNTYEKALEATHVGLEISARHKSKIGISVGIEQTEITENYKINRETVESEIIEGVIERKINLQGDTIDIIGDIIQTTTTTLNKNLYNTYQLLEIPILMTYDISYNHWDVNLEAGVIANLSLKTTGTIPDEFLMDQNINIDQDEIFKSKLGLSYQLGTSIGKSITKRLKFYVTPRVRFYTQDFTVSSYGLSQKYMLIGIRAGLRYNLN